jgi:D-glycero-D-manno-heptose 1,7-bisphosphate phosphatase
VVTNQPDVPRGRLARETVEAMHLRLSAALPLDEIRVCYHDRDDNCSCRKPSPGMLLERSTYAVEQSVMVGDRWRDIEAGRRLAVVRQFWSTIATTNPCRTSRTCG